MFTSHALIPYAGYGHNVVNTEAGGEIRKGGVEREHSSSVSAGTSTCEPISIIRTTEFPFTVIYFSPLALHLSNHTDEDVGLFLFLILVPTPSASITRYPGSMSQKL